MKQAVWTVLKAIKWALLGLIGLATLAVFMLYLPPVQDFIVPRVLNAINKPGELEISVARFRLYFPLDVEVDTLGLLTPDMEVNASKASLDVDVLPLLKGKISANDLKLDKTRFRLGTPDSALYLNADLQLATIDHASVRLAQQKVKIGYLLADSGNIEMAIRPDTIPKPQQTDSVPSRWNIALDRGELKNISYNMTLEPTITDLNCRLADGNVVGAELDMLTKTVNVKEVTISEVDARYIYPTAEYLAAHPVEPTPTDTVPTVPWTINCNRISLTGSSGLYALNGALPLGSNFDLNYIQASEIEVQIDSFMNRGTTVHAPIKRFYARERCGIPVELSGTFDMDSTMLSVTDMLLQTATSTIGLTAYMGLPQTSNQDSAQTSTGGSASAVDPATPFSLNLTADISNDDIRRLAPAELSAIANSLPRGVPLQLQAKASGRIDNIKVETLSLELPRHLALEASGHIANVLDINRAVGELEISGSMPDGGFIKPTLMDAKLAREVNLPPLTIDGTVDFNRGDIAGDLTATTGNGTVALTGEWRNREEGYALSMDALQFPLQSIMPGLGISDITATLDVEGCGFDPFSSSTALHGLVTLDHIGYHGTPYENLSAEVALEEGMAAISARSANRGANFEVNAGGNLVGDTLRWSFDGDLKDINLRTLKLTDSIAEGSIALSGKALFTLPKSQILKVNGKKVVATTPMTFDTDLDVSQLYWRMADGTVNASGIQLKAASDTLRTLVDVDNGDLCIRAYSPEPLDSILSSTDRLTRLLNRCLQSRQIPVDSVQQILPQLDLRVDAGRNNVLASYLLDSDISFDKLNLIATNDSLISGSLTMRGLTAGETAIDSIDMNFNQHDKLLLYNLQVNNRPGTLDQFAHVQARGYLGFDKFSLIFHQSDIDDETGYSFGSVITMPEADVVSLTFVPYHPIIGYQQWEINRDNYVNFNIRNNHIDANINLQGEKSSLKLFTEHNDNDTVQEALRLQIDKLRIQDWLAINPFAPPVKGDLSADMSVTLGEKSINGSGTVSLADFYYGRDKVGDFDAEIDLQTNAAGTVRATTTLMVDGVKTITASGNLNDSTALNPFNLDLKMIHFPLSVLNPFLPSGTAKMGGMLNGEMDLTGEMTAPIVNGWVSFDSTAVNVTMLGSFFDFSEEKIPVKNNVITFDNFEIKAVNENPLRINGTADITDLSNIRLNLGLNANNTQLVGSKQKKGQDVYGKAYVDIDATVKGSLSRFLAVKANVKVLPGTNATYVISDVQSAISSASNADMVKFVNFADTTAVEAADSIATTGLVMNIDATLDISEGSTLAVDLSSDGKNRAQVQASGRINYSSDFLGDERVTGRLTVDQGYVRYGMAPVMSEKLFQIKSGSNVVFNGQLLNPTLDLHAYDEVKANVSSDGNSRSVSFDVGLDVTGTLEQMNVVFDLSTTDDLTVQDELSAMTADQRANQAMNLLLYGSYTGPGTKASTMTNPLYTFLAGQLNSLASSAIKGVDISFGIDELARTRDGVSSTAMSYSYKVSKSLFDDRFKIVVGGNYTTDADADENFAQNLIADISFEYLLNPEGTMYVKIFRHTGYESILEGEITQTGVGFVYKKKIHSLSDLFYWLKRRKNEEEKQ